MKVKDIKIGEGIPKICVPVQGSTLVELCDELTKLDELNIDIIEWRADCFEEIDNQEKVRKVLNLFKEKQRNTPLLFTFRTKQEGGNKEIETKDYIQLLRVVMRTQLVDLIDIELSKGDEIVEALIENAKKEKVVTVISNHDFEKTPSECEMIGILTRMIKIGADISKLAVMPKNESDVINLLGATVKVKSLYNEKVIVTMSMGKLGAISRITGEAFGSALTFGSGAKASAPGQIECNKLHKVLEELHSTL